MRRILLTVFSAILLLCVFAAPAHADEHPIKLTIAVAPDTMLVEGGKVEYLTFTIANRSNAPYTLYRAELSGGFEGVTRQLDGEITVPAGGTKEFVLHDIPVAEEQLGRSVTYTLSWDEQTVITGAEGEQTDYTARSASAAVSIERFSIPELSISVTVDVPHVLAGESFTATYRIANDTKYDMTSIRLSDPRVYDGAIPLPQTELTAGESILVPVTYTMGEDDMLLEPTLTYLAARRQIETTIQNPVTVGSVVTGVSIEVVQYPANEEGTMFAITVLNTGNRALRQLQLFDEINTPIDAAFDLGPQQHKAITFTVPSAYAAGQVRTVRFHLTGTDFFGQPFTYDDPNSYTCTPFVTSDAVRVSVFATITNAYLDEAGKLCGTLQIEIRNYSDVRLYQATLEETELFGVVQSYEELQRGETYYTPTYQLDNVPQLSFRVSVTDPAGQLYYTEPVTVSLENLRAMATADSDPTILYYSNTFLRQLTEKITSSFRNILLVVFVLVLLSASMCTVLWILEYRITSRLPREGMLSIRVPASKPAAEGAMDHVLEGSPAEQLGYIAPAKIRYGAAATQQKTTALGDLLFASKHKPKQRISDETTAFRPVGGRAPAPVKTKPAVPSKPRVRVIEAVPQPKRRALRPNERIRIGFGRES